MITRLFHSLYSYFLDLYYRFWYPLPADEPQAQLYVDQNGVAWPRHPDHQNVDQPDEGQHDIWKKDMRIFLWRALWGPEEPGVMALEPLGFGRRTETVPVLYPVGEQLAAQARKFGFPNLARAAMPEITEAQILNIYHRNEVAVRAEAQLRAERGARVATTWDEARMGYAYQVPLAEDVVAQLTLGPCETPLGAITLKPVPLLPSNAPNSTTNFQNFTKAKR